jgi:hypothetical protein
MVNGFQWGWGQVSEAKKPPGKAGGWSRKDKQKKVPRRLPAKLIEPESISMPQTSSSLFGFFERFDRL